MENLCENFKADYLFAKFPKQVKFDFIEEEI